MTLFLTHRPDGTIIVQALMEDGGMTGDMVSIVNPGESFYAVPYDTLAALPDGAVEYDAIVAEHAP